MTPKPKACEGCDAYKVGSGFVPFVTPEAAKLALVGQGPGADEAALSEPFVGQAGRRLNRWLVKAGVPREKCAVGNVVQCHLPKNRPPKAAEIAHCWKAHTEPWLASLTELRCIVAVGQPAAKRLIGPRVSVSTVGTTHIDDQARYVVPIVHPAAIPRGGWHHDPIQPKFLRRAWEIANSTAPVRIANLEQPPPRGTVATRVDTVAYYCGELLRSRATVTADIEGVGGVLIGIGFCRTDTLESLYIPFRDRAAPFWSGEWDTRAVATWVDRVLASPDVGKIWHNGFAFDIPFLESIGFECNGYVDDTMVRSWGTYHEAAKDLQSLAIVYAGLPAWKHLSHVGDEGEAK